MELVRKLYLFNLLIKFLLISSCFYIIYFFLGLAMATMDIIKLHGGNPANFLDVGGNAGEEGVI